jgi:hypothetical protein
VIFLTRKGSLFPFTKCIRKACGNFMDDNFLRAMKVSGKQRNRIACLFLQRMPALIFNIWIQ